MADGARASMVHEAQAVVVVDGEGVPIEPTAPMPIRPHRQKATLDPDLHENPDAPASSGGAFLPGLRGAPSRQNRRQNPRALLAGDFNFA